MLNIIMIYVKLFFYSFFSGKEPMKIKLKFVSQNYYMRIQDLENIFFEYFVLATLKIQIFS